MCSRNEEKTFDNVKIAILYKCTEWQFNIRVRPFYFTILLIALN